MDFLTDFNAAKAAEKLNEILQFKNEVIVADTDDTLTLTKEDSGKTIVLKKADGVEVALPMAEVGLRYRFLVETSVTSGGYNIRGNTTDDLFIGVLQMVDTDGGTDTHTDQIADVVDDDSIELNGTTSGGLIGTQIFVECVKANRWFVQGVVRYSGDIATPFDESFTTTAAPTTTAAATTTGA